MRVALLEGQGAAPEHRHIEAWQQLNASLWVWLSSWPSAARMISIASWATRTTSAYASSRCSRRHWSRSVRALTHCPPKAPSSAMIPPTAGPRTTDSRYTHSGTDACIGGTVASPARACQVLVWRAADRE